jgi:hypothetical protein
MLTVLDAPASKRRDRRDETLAGRSYNVSAATISRPTE